MLQIVKQVQDWWKRFCMLLAALPALCEPALHAVQVSRMYLHLAQHFGHPSRLYLPCELNGAVT